MKGTGDISPPDQALFMYTLAPALWDSSKACARLGLHRLPLNPSSHSPEKPLSGLGLVPGDGAGTMGHSGAAPHQTFAPGLQGVLPSD